MKTSELTGAALDWAVAMASGREVKLTLRSYLGDNPGPEFLALEWEHDWQELNAYCPSTDWAQGGPIIEREKIVVIPPHDDIEDWEAYHPTRSHNEEYGPTPLIAAMRCYVASKMGDEVDIPKELQC